MKNGRTAAVLFLLAGLAFGLSAYLQLPDKHTLRMIAQFAAALLYLVLAVVYFIKAKPDAKA